ncbi:phospho-N-acetylmuramoyl-pentapeptide-transferase homolog isoform X2 [Brassica rapa]|uniref:phospho-N-acetylmuramoyl-pentapeptide- transferase homolog isoform X2 n=1 Tax=Brassica campestris TaxID=3711 RepID=UPI0004F1C247|nr:phospho-N-acetylmuramoyl-pentapeptide-transferase homolog isoform X2 [Brassica rapa]
MRSIPLSGSSYRIHHPNPFRCPESLPLLSVTRLRVLQSRSPSSFKFNVARHGCTMGHISSFSVKAFDDDSFDYDSGDIFAAAYSISSSEGEESDGEYGLNVVTETTAQRLAKFPRGRKKHRIRYGINLGLLAFLTLLLLFMDSFAWKIVRLPLPPYFLSLPFFTSAILVTLAGYICVPMLDRMKVHEPIRRLGLVTHSRRQTIPTMGGLFFVPIGVIVAIAMTKFSSIEVAGAAAVTVLFAAVGLVDDFLSLCSDNNNGLSAKIQLLLEGAVGTGFAFWLERASISSPYGMKMLVPLPSPLGLICLGKLYLLLTSLYFVSMGNLVKATDGLDGLAGGIAALAFVAMAIVVLPICSDLSIFGASMAGACFGFLLHNRYRASVSMGGTGSLAIGGALAAMAACSGMFLPLFISSGVSILEAASVIIQVAFYSATKRLKGKGRRVFKTVPFHHHLRLSGLKEPMIVTMAYVISSLLSLSAAYIGLISV